MKVCWYWKHTHYSRTAFVFWMFVGCAQLIFGGQLELFIGFVYMLKIYFNKMKTKICVLCMLCDTRAYQHLRHGYHIFKYIHILMIKYRIQVFFRLKIHTHTHRPIHKSEVCFWSDLPTRRSHSVDKFHSLQWQHATKKSVRRYCPYYCNKTNTSNKIAIFPVNE